MAGTQLWGMAAAIQNDKRELAEARAESLARNGQPCSIVDEIDEQCYQATVDEHNEIEHVEFNLEKSSRESARENELLDWCDDLKSERDELREASLEIVNHNSQLLEVCRNEDETIAHLRACIERSHQEHLADIQELQQYNNNQISGVGQSKERVIQSMQKTIDEQDSQIENLFQQLQELDNRPY